MEIGLTPPPFVHFHLLFKRTLPPPPLIVPFLHDEQWTRYLKKSEKHIDVKTKNEEEVEGVHDNSSAFMHLNIKAHK